MIGAKDTDVRDVIKEVLEKEEVAVKRIKNGHLGPLNLLVNQVKFYFNWI